MKTFRYRVEETNIGFVDIEAENEEEAQDIFYSGEANNHQINKCSLEITKLIEIKE